MDELRLPYRDRREAGQALAQRLGHLRGDPAVLVLGLPRGGVAVAFEVAQALHAPLDILVVRKLGYPGQEEYAMGAIASGGVCIMTQQPGPGVSQADIEAVIARERDELSRREALYRGEAPRESWDHRHLLLVDDGLATGSTMRAAVAAARRHRPSRITVAVPVGDRTTCASLSAEADEVVCAAMPGPFRAVSLWYRDFPQAGDDEVRALLAQARRALEPH